MSSFGRLTGFGLKGKESVNAPFSAEQTLKAELLAIADASHSDILSKLQHVAPNILKSLTSTQQERDLHAATLAAETARAHESDLDATVIPTESAPSYQVPPTQMELDARANIEEALRVPA
jgi:hypothetical protein